MDPPRRALLPAPRELPHAVHARSFQQQQARVAVRPLVPPHQAVVHQRARGIENLARGDARRDAQGLDGGERAAAGRDGEPAEQAPLTRVEQPLAPRDRGLQRPLPRGGVARPVAQGPQAACQARAQLARGEQPAARGHALEGQRQAVERLAERDDIRGRGRGECDVGPHRPRPLHEEAHRRDPGQRVDVPGRGRSIGQGQGRHGEYVLPAHAQGDPAGDQRRRLRAVREHVGQRRAGRGHLLHVIEHQKHTPAAQGGDERVARSAPHVEGARERGLGIGPGRRARIGPRNGRRRDGGRRPPRRGG